ncbi:Beta-barrel assembly-enhancing protease [uncultured archaeon]|nr:Beta-barrel assembly-enhancing protease [uncultured archaeon]
MKLVLSILAILLIAGVALAHETVCPSGCDGNSIQAAVYAAHPNDTIDVYSGTYNESVVLTKDVTFRGIDTGSGEPIVNGDLYLNGFNMVLRGFGFQSISPGLADTQNMTTKDTTFYWIEKAFETTSKSTAIASLDKIIKANPRDAWALYRKGWILSDTGRYEESTDILKESIKVDPYFASPWNLIGNNFWTGKNSDKALEAYEKAIQLRPNKGLYWFNKGDALKELGRNSEAEEAYAKASAFGYGNFAVANEAAIPGPIPTPGTFVTDHIMSSNVDEYTNNVITRAYEFTNTDSKAYSWLNLGKAGNNTVKWMWYSPDGNLYRTETVDVPAPSGDYWRSYNVWSYIYIAGNDAANMPGDWHVDVYLDGQKVFTEYFSISEDRSTAPSGYQPSAPVAGQSEAASWLNQGIALANQSKYDEAIQAFDKAIKINPQYEAAWFLKGAALNRQGMYADAIQAYDKAIEINPGNESTWTSKGVALGNLDKYDEAALAFDRAIEINPENYVAWYLKGAALDQQGKTDEAIVACDKATEINPQDDYAWYIKGKVLEDLGRYGEAIRAFDNSTQINPQNVDAWYDKGETFYWQGKYNESIQALDMVTKIDPQDADAWYIKSMALDELGKHDEADLAYNRSIEIDPEIEEEWWGY